MRWHSSLWSLHDSVCNDLHRLVFHFPDGSKNRLLLQCCPDAASDWLEFHDSNPWLLTPSLFPFSPSSLPHPHLSVMASAYVTIAMSRPLSSISCSRMQEWVAQWWGSLSLAVYTHGGSIEARLMLCRRMAVCSWRLHWRVNAMRFHWRVNTMRFHWRVKTMRIHWRVNAMRFHWKVNAM